jgi:hypothetical protein
MQPPAILVVTGASGAGKTASVRALESLSLPGVRCFYFDSVGVPGTEEMERAYGGGEGWQAAMTAQWMRRLVTEETEVAVLDGQTRPSIVRAAIAAVAAPWSTIVLLDCSPEERGRRLAGPRGQPELASEGMSAWAAYLRGQADALGLPVVDTTEVSFELVAAKLAAAVERLRQARAAARTRQASTDELGRISLADMRERLSALRSTAERAMAQVSDTAFTAAPDPDTNSIAITVKHVAGNLRSRFTGFGETDGEKPDRDRDGEFVLTPADSRERLMARWSEGWELLERAVDGIDPGHLTHTVTIRDAPHTVIGALHRNLAHVAYHVGQIVQLAKHYAGPEWRTLTIPRGASKSWRGERR